MEPVGIGLALLAGVLSTLSPCVLPILPMVLGAAVSEHRFGPAALAAGLTLSFVAIGLFVATIGFSLGLDGGIVPDRRRHPAGGLRHRPLVPHLQARVAVAAGPVGNWAEHRFGGFSPGGLGGQFRVGLLLGAVWSPCIGPTLGAASVLAAQSRDLGQVALTMTVFGIGAASPLLLLGLLSREALTRWRGRPDVGRTAVPRWHLASCWSPAAVLILSEADKTLEAGSCLHHADLAGRAHNTLLSRRGH